MRPYKNVNTVTKYLLLDQTLNVFEASLNSVLTNTEVTVEYMVDAVSSRVTTTMFPLEDLLHALDIGKANFSQQPLYTEDITQYYYPLHESTLTNDVFVIHIPLKSLDVFSAYQNEAFPFSAY